MSLIKETTENITTPVGVLAWVSILGEGKEKMDATKGREYCANIVLPEAEFKTFNDTIQAFYNRHKPKEKHNFREWKVAHCNPDGTLNEDKEGTHRSLQFRTNVNINHNGEVKRFKVPVANASGQPVELGATLIGNGSKGLIHGKLGVYFYAKTKTYGVMFMLSGVQILDLVPYTAGTKTEFKDLSGQGSFQDVAPGDVPVVSAAPTSGNAGSAPQQTTLEI